MIRGELAVCCDAAAVAAVEAALPGVKPGFARGYGEGCRSSDCKSCWQAGGRSWVS